MSALLLRLDYRARRVDVHALRRLDWAELINLIPVEGLEVPGGWGRAEHFRGQEPRQSWREIKVDRRRRAAIEVNYQNNGGVAAIKVVKSQRGNSRSR